MVVYSPGQDLVVMRQSDGVHAAHCKLDNPHICGGELGVEAGALDVDHVAGASEAEFSAGAFAEDEDVEPLSRGFVDHDPVFEAFLRSAAGSLNRGQVFFIFVLTLISDDGSS